jgi:hypothetical protein
MASKKESGFALEGNLVAKSVVPGELDKKCSFTNTISGDNSKTKPGGMLQPTFYHDKKNQNEWWRTFISQMAHILYSSTTLGKNGQEK